MSRFTAKLLWILHVSQLVATTKVYALRVVVGTSRRHLSPHDAAPVRHTRNVATTTPVYELVDDSRRRVWNGCGTAVASILATALCPVQPCHAAPPMTAGEADGLGARLERQFRPKAPKVIRSKLDQDFAVLLMRSSYNALDQIDCVAMDQFQRDFFFIRQAEYQPYIEQLGPGVVQQGMLTDPYYFDFISFAQYATISREIRESPLSIFEEQQPGDVNGGEGEPQTFVTTIVRRDPSITNDMLATRHSQLVGKAILDRLDETFANTASAIPIVPSGRLDSTATLVSLTQLMKLFLLNGFAFDGNVAIMKQDSSGTEFCITLTNPANLWSGKALEQRRADPRNSFILKAATELICRAGYAIKASSVKYEANQEKSYITIP